ncbi:hypothetical protein B6N60_05172 [Richelia sinica FACHB-800]|uniref:Uncharacterized protein n=1 Tax=Richelia sinica FACHB-800 TaxID=1357546 RepID=A0A975TCW6_9NOST|nr:hypothetical protein B6N60_05172 [Richelia sinica FACHB-800]
MLLANSEFNFSDRYSWFSPASAKIMPRSIIMIFSRVCRRHS